VIAYSRILELRDSAKRCLGSKIQLILTPEEQFEICGMLIDIIETPLTPAREPEPEVIRFTHLCSGVLGGNTVLWAIDQFGQLWSRRPFAEEPQLWVRSTMPQVKPL
jgi:hypothetical protein